MLRAMFFCSSKAHTRQQQSGTAGFSFVPKVVAKVTLPCAQVRRRRALFEMEMRVGVRLPSVLHHLSRKTENINMDGTSFFFLALRDVTILKKRTLASIETKTGSGVADTLAEAVEPEKCVHRMTCAVYSIYPRSIKSSSFLDTESSVCRISGNPQVGAIECATAPMKPTQGRKWPWCFFGSPNERKTCTDTLAYARRNAHCRQPLNYAMRQVQRVAVPRTMWPPPSPALHLSMTTPEHLTPPLPLSDASLQRPRGTATAGALDCCARAPRLDCCFAIHGHSSSVAWWHPMPSDSVRCARSLAAAVRHLRVGPVQADPRCGLLGGLHRSLLRASGERRGRSQLMCPVPDGVR